MNAATGRFLLVNTLPQPGGAEHNAVFRAICAVPGVGTVCDLAAISRETLDVILYRPSARTLEPASAAPEQQAALFGEEVS